MPPFVAAAEILASPVANTRIPQASDLPTLEPVAAGPADTGPFILMVAGANTGTLPTAPPANKTAQDTVSTSRLQHGYPSLTRLTARFVYAHTTRRERSPSRATGTRAHRGMRRRAQRRMR